MKSVTIRVYADVKKKFDKVLDEILKEKLYYNKVGLASQIIQEYCENYYKEKGKNYD